MKFAIVGAGMAGSYLYKLLKNEGEHEVQIFDIPKHNKCGEKSCAWGMTPVKDYAHLIDNVGLDSSKYIMDTINHIYIDGVEIEARAVTVNKPQLIRDLFVDPPIIGLCPILSDYDYVIDATGAARAYLPELQTDLMASCIQYRIREPGKKEAYFNSGILGYEWCFPLGKDEYHIGSGRITLPVGTNFPTEGVICKCMSEIRLSSPYYSQPFVHGNVWGVGESIGTVGPLGADGNIYAMECAQLLNQNLGDQEKYTKAVLKKFGWMKREREILDKLIQGKNPSVFDAWAFMQHSRRVGFKIGIKQAWELLKKGRRAKK